MNFTFFLFALIAMVVVVAVSVESQLLGELALERRLLLDRELGYEPLGLGLPLI